jgi:hypothetical protein
LVDNIFCKLAENESRINVTLKALVYASHSQQNIWRFYIFIKPVGEKTGLLRRATSPGLLGKLESIKV